MVITVHIEDRVLILCASERTSLFSIYGSSISALAKWPLIRIKRWKIENKTMRVPAHYRWAFGPLERKRTRWERMLVNGFFFFAFQYHRVSSRVF